MNTNPLNLNELLALGRNLGASEAELLALGRNLGAPEAELEALSKTPRTVPLLRARVTVGEYAVTVEPRFPKRSAGTYRPGLRRLVDAYGQLFLDEVTLPMLEALRDRIHEEVGRDIVERARRTGKLLRSYDPSAHGHCAAEHFTSATRFLFRQAVNEQLLVVNPALELRAPRRPPAAERPLSDEELDELVDALYQTSTDLDLDERVFRFHRHTAARRAGALMLRCGHLDWARATVVLSEKNGKTRELPLAQWVIDDLLAFAASRGSTKPEDPVFISRGRPMSRRRYNTIFDRIDRVVPWAARDDVGIHWIRHTTVCDIERVAGTRVAEAFAGHSDASLGTIGIYTKPDFSDLVEAYEAVFGPRYA